MSDKTEPKVHIKEEVHLNESNALLPEQPISSPVSPLLPLAGKSREWTHKLKVASLLLAVILIPLFCYAQHLGMVSAALAALDPSMDHLEKYRRYLAASAQLMRLNRREVLPVAEFYTELAIRETELARGRNNGWKYLGLISAEADWKWFCPSEKSKIDLYQARIAECVESVYGPRSKEMAQCLGALAGSQYEAGERRPADHNWWRATRTAYIAQSFFTDGRFEDWLDGYQLRASRSIKPQASTIDPLHFPEEIQNDVSKASLFTHQKKFKEAESLYLETIKKVENPLLTYSSDRNINRWVKGAYAGFLLRVGRVDESRQIERSLNLLEGKDFQRRPLPRWIFPRDIELSMGRAVHAYAFEGHDKEAEELFQLALAQAQSLDQRDDIYQQVLATVKNRYAGFLRYRGRLSEALKLEQEVDIIRSSLCPSLMAADKAL